MRLVDDLQREHALIDAVLGSLWAWAKSETRPAADGADFVRFLRVFAGHFHHAREEDVLFPALVAQASLPADRGPIAILTREHRELEGLLAQLEPLLRAPPTDAQGRERFTTLLTHYTHGLWHHIDAENSVMLPEAEERLRRNHVHELDGRGPSADEEAARAAGERLVKTWPPQPDPACLRGDGCVMCPSYGSTCAGLEREWWNESEWEEAPGRFGGG